MSLIQRKVEKPCNNTKNLHKQVPIADGAKVFNVVPPKESNKPFYFECTPDIGEVCVDCGPIKPISQEISLMPFQYPMSCLCP